tara:strand:- start:20269 stop:21432 length:1164 start_codon:yes stop_codon:yes gene_type:complete
VTGTDRPLEGDEPEYHAVSVLFANGDGWGVDGQKSKRSPLISFLASGLYFLLGTDASASRWMFVFFSSLTSPLVFIVVNKMSKRYDVGILVAVAWALYPPSIWYAGLITTETMSSLLVVATVGVFVWAATSQGIWHVVVAGLVFGLLSLNRSLYLFLPVALMITQVILSRVTTLEWSWSGRQWALCLIVFSITMAPWTIHNYVEHGVFMPHSTQSGMLLLITNGTLDNQFISRGMYYKNPELIARVYNGSDSEVGRDRLARAIAIAEIKKNWHLLPKAVVNRAKNFWTPRPDPYNHGWTINDLIMIMIWVPVLIFFLSSSMIRSWGKYWPMLAIIGYAFLLTLPFWGTPRFRFPVDALILCGGVMGFLEVIHLVVPSVASQIQKKIR